LAEILDHQHSVTGHWLRLPRIFPSRGKRRPIQQSRENGRKRTADRSGPSFFLELVNASANNLQKLTVRFPLQRFVVVSGVSGSGKSTLVRRCLLERLKECLQRKKPPEDLRGWEPIKGVYEVDQSPIGRTPRSIPATYVGFFDHIRALFAQIPEARLRGYTAGRFSFNSPQGRCPGCQGAGNIKLEMSFMPAAYTRCEACAGTRFLPETLEIELRGKTIAQVLDMDMGEALEFFQAFPKVRQPLEALRDTGLDYLKLGQISPTLSGGEAQRMKLVTHLLSGLKGTRDLFSQDKPHNLFILEEPTIGLHMADVHRLVPVLQRLVDAGHSVIVIEHNLELIAEADWVIDLGPEGGDRGGKVVASGTPEEIAACPGSHTGRFLRRVLK
jgi:excinuclease ABC subunit A